MIINCYFLQHRYYIKREYTFPRSCENLTRFSCQYIDIDNNNIFLVFCANNDTKIRLRGRWIS